MEVKLNYYDEFQQLSSSQVFSDQNRDINLPFIKDARIFSDTTFICKILAIGAAPVLPWLLTPNDLPILLINQLENLSVTFYATSPVATSFYAW